MNWKASVRARVGEVQINVDLEGDERPLVLAGPNGAGKTTLLRILAGVHEPATGTIALGGRTLLDSSGSICVPPERRRVGYVPQGYALFPHLRALDNVAFGLRSGPKRLSKARRRERASKMLERLGCIQLAHRWPSGLSGGERQRIALARALVVDPDLLLLDEPLSALDVASRRRMRAFLVEHLQQRGRPAIVVTHDLRDIIALDVEVAVLEAGRIVQRGPLQMLRKKPASDFVAELCDLPLDLASPIQRRADR